jgi:hypothetical protein
MTVFVGHARVSLWPVIEIYPVGINRKSIWIVPETREQNRAAHCFLGQFSGGINTD